MKKYFMDLLVVSLIAIAIFYAVRGVYFSVKNPGLTQTQVFLKIWGIPEGSEKTEVCFNPSIKHTIQESGREIFVMGYTERLVKDGGFMIITGSQQGILTVKDVGYSLVRAHGEVLGGDTGMFKLIQSLGGTE